MLNPFSTLRLFLSHLLSNSSTTKFPIAASPRPGVIASLFLLLLTTTAAAPRFAFIDETTELFGLERTVGIVSGGSTGTTAPVWTQQTSGTSNNLFSVHFVSETVGWAVGFSNTILNTTNGGVNWTAQTNQGVVPVSSYLGVRFTDANTGWAGGGSAVVRTTDGGVSWAEQGATQDGRFRNNLFTVSPTVAWIPARNTTNTSRWFSRFTVGVGEENFNVIGGSSQYFDMNFTDANNGWAVGTGPIVLITNASSASPSFGFQTSCPCPTLNGVFMLDSLTGWSVGNGGLILKTSNGSTWLPQTSGTTVNLNSVHFVNANQGWAVGNGGLILKSIDGGAAWTPETSGVTADLRRVFFVNANKGYAVGHNGTILKYADASAPGSLQFAAANTNDAETNSGSHTVNIAVTRTGGSDEAVSVEYTVSNGTATTADNDYSISPATGTLNWSDGDMANKNINITVNGDTTYEANETVNLTLSSPQGGATLGSPNPATLTLTNDDAAPASASLVVNTTDDLDFGACVTAHCSLREAINAANSNTSDANTTAFNIPLADPGFAGGVFTIMPTSGLPTIRNQTNIDGTTQTAFTGDTNASGPEIVLNGSLAGPEATGLYISGDSNAISSLVVNGFNGLGIGISYPDDSTPSNNQILNNYIGTNPSGTAAVANGSGVDVHGFSSPSFPASFNTVSGNVISGNTTTGLSLCDARLSTVSGNLIGTDPTGANDVGNGSHGIYFTCAGAPNNTMSGNTIAFNQGDGWRDEPDYRFAVAFLSTGHQGNKFTQNSMFANAGLALNLLPPPFGTIDGVTPNDAMDSDTGGNKLQNFAVITAAIAGATNTITGTLNTTANSSAGYTIEFFSNPVCDGSGNGEGKTYLGSVTTGNTDANGDVGFTFNPATLSVGDVVTATATDTNGNTSEFSACFTVTSGNTPPTIAKAFSPTTVGTGGVSILTITITNPSANTAALTGVGVTDSFPAGMEVDAVPTPTNTCSGATYNPTAGAASITLSGGSIAAGGNCSFSVTVRGTTAGAKLNTTDNVTSTNGGTGGTASATLTVGYSIAGTVSYGTTPSGDPAKFVQSVTLTAVGTPQVFTTNDSVGSYLLNGLGSGPYTVTPSKAAQTDNNGISLQDASEVAKYVFNQRTFTPNQIIAADATGNGTVSLQDASEIAKRTFNIASTNIVRQWKFSPASRNYPSISANLTGENYDAILIGDVTGNWTPPVADPPAEATKESAKEATAKPEGERGKTRSALSEWLSGLPDSASDSSEEKRNAGAAISVSLPNAQGNANTTVLIPVTVGTLTNVDNVTAYDLTVTFDPLILQPASPAFETAGTLTAAAGGYSVFVDTMQPSGSVRIGAFGTTPLTGSGTLIFLRFTVLAGAAATSPLNFDNFIFGEGTPADVTPPRSFMRLGPTAAVSIGGRVFTADGRAVAKARLTLTGQNGEVRTALTNSFGYYRFTDIAAGETYIIGVAHKLHRFDSKVLSANENLSEINFIGLEALDKVKR